MRPAETARRWTPKPTASRVAAPVRRRTAVTWCPSPPPRRAPYTLPRALPGRFLLSDRLRGARTRPKQPISQQHDDNPDRDEPKDDPKLNIIELDGDREIELEPLGRNYELRGVRNVRPRKLARQRKRSHFCVTRVHGALRGPPHTRPPPPLPHTQTHSIPARALTQSHDHKLNERRDKIANARRPVLHIRSVALRAWRAH